MSEETGYPQGRLLHRPSWQPLRLGWPEGREALTEFTLTVMHLSTLIKETETLQPRFGEILTG